MKRYFVSLIAGLAFVASPLFAQDSVKPARGDAAAQNQGSGPRTQPAALLDAKAVMKSAKAVTAEKYPDAKTVLVSKHVRTEYETNGAFLAVTEEYSKVMT